MPAISFGGLNSGLPPDIVERLMEAERIPLKKMEEDKSKSSDRLKLVTDLETKISGIRGSLSELANTHGFSDIKLMSGDPNVIQGAVDPTAARSGNWNVEVVKLAEKAAAITNGFPDKDSTEVGIGYIKFDTPDGEKEIYINGNNNTLEGVAATINAAGAGIRATVINDRKEPDSPWKLVLSADNVGADNDVSYPTLYFLDGDQDLYFDQKRDASNGIVKIDGFEFEISENKLKDMIPGVTLDLKQAAPGKTININVKEDLEVVSGKIKTFVDAVNGVLQFIQQQNQMNEKTDTSRTLGGDSLLRSVEMRFRSLLQNSQMGTGSGVQRLSQLGIAFNRAGTLDFDQKKFDNTLASDPEGVHRFFMGDGFNTGFVNVTKREIGILLQAGFGQISNRKRSLQQKIDQIDQRVEQKERQLVRKEETLRNKFAKLEESIGRIKSQGGAMAAFVGQGNGGGQG